MLKLFPHALAVGLSDEELTEEQWRWFECQLLLDEGFDACPACDVLGQGPYCGACGTRVAPAGRTCEQCHLISLGAYCMACGTALVSPVAEAIDEGRFDWAGWARSLTPFLGGLTAREQELLQRNGVPEDLYAHP